MGFKTFKRVLKFFIPPIIILSIASVSYLRALDNYELGALDFRFRVRSVIAKIPVTDKVTMIEIGEDSIKKLGRFPFDRSYHAILIKALSEFGAKAIVFDIFFSEPQEHDRELEDAIRKAGNVYLPFAFDIDVKKRDRVISADDYLAKCLENFALLAKGTGHINIVPDIDGKFRRIPLYIRYGNGLYPYLSFLASCDYLGIPEKDIKILPGKYLLCGKELKIPLDDSSNMIVNFIGKWGGAYKHYSYVDVLQSYFAYIAGQKATLDLNEFKDKICIVGLTAAGTGDLHPSPFEVLYPGVGIHADLFNSMMNKKFIIRSSRDINLLILLILSLLMLLMILKTKPIKGLLALVTSVLFFIGISIYIFSFFDIWIDVVYPILAMAFVYISLTLYKYIVEWKKRITFENELGIAKKIQESFLPKAVPNIQGLDIASCMFTARQVGGDLYDFIEFDQEKLAVVIGDVSGKGIPASLFMAMVTGAVKFFATPQERPSDVLSMLNSKLIKESSSNLFVTMFYVIFDIKNKKMAYSNGGHLPLMHLSRGKGLEFLDTEVGAPLGLMEGPYSDKEVDIKIGDIFIFYTDGITEAMDARREMYGKERLASVVETHKVLSSKDILSAIERDVRKFEPRSKQHDDMTMVGIKII